MRGKGKQHLTGLVIERDGDKSVTIEHEGVSRRLQLDIVTELDFEKPAFVNIEQLKDGRWRMVFTKNILGIGAWGQSLDK